MEKNFWRILPTALLILTVLIGVGLIPETNYVKGQYIPPHKLIIQVNNQNGGTTTPNPTTILVDDGLSVQVTAAPKFGYVFTGWYLDGIYQHELSTITVTMHHDSVLMATFSQQPVALTITTNPQEGGNTNPPTGTTFYQYGSSVQVTVDPNPGYLFDGWYLDGEFMGIQTTITVSMSHNTELGAYFASISPPEPEPEPEPIQLPPATLSVSCESHTSYSEFNVMINGVLTGNGVPLSNAGILIYVSVSGGNSWDILSFVNTDSNGKFSVSWKPSVTGTFLLNSTWLGNSEYASTSTTVNFAVTPFEEQSVFSVTSNSTLSGLVFNSENNELGFSVTGPSGTTGYTNVMIPKSLINDISNLIIYVDGNEMNYTSESQTDVWEIYFTYPHSTHQVVVNLESPPPQSTPETPTEPETPEEPEQPSEPEPTDEEVSLSPFNIPMELLLAIVVIVAIIVVAVVGYKFGKGKRASKATESNSEKM